MPFLSIFLHLYPLFFDLTLLFCYNLDMVNEMEKINYIKINTKNLIDNIHFIKRNYAYDYYIFNVSNYAFHHGLYLIQYLSCDNHYLYVNHLSDLLLIRKYNQEIPVIYNGPIDEDMVYDLVINNAILVVHDLDTLKMIRQLNIKDTLSFLFYIDPTGYFGIRDKQDILEYLEWDQKYFQLLGIMAQIDEKDFENFKYITRPLKNLSIMILNYEEDKRKIQGSNAILLDSSFYGINQIKKKLFQKTDTPLKQCFTLYSKVISIKEIVHNKKTKYIATIPFGYHHGMDAAIKNVFISNKLYPIAQIRDEFSLIEVDQEIKKDMKVEITSDKNPLENYYSYHPLNYFCLFSSHLPIVFDDYILEKTLIY